MGKRGGNHGLDLGSKRGQIPVGFAENPSLMIINIFFDNEADKKLTCESLFCVASETDSISQNGAT